MASRAKTFFIKPLKLFSYYDTVYLHARKDRGSGEPFKAPEFDPLLAVHRIRIEKMEMTDRLFEFPKDYQKAGDKGNTGAMWTIGQMYADARGGSRDHE
jgi:hypothetical protein